MDSFGTKQSRSFLRVNYDIGKIKMGLSLDEEFLILAVESLVRKIRPIILFGDADHELKYGTPLWGEVLNHLERLEVVQEGEPYGGSPPANGGLSPHIPNTDPKQDWVLSIPHLPE